MAKRITATAPLLPVGSPYRGQVWLALAIGVACCLLLGPDWRLLPPYLALLAAVIVANWRAAANTVEKFLQPLQRPSRKARVLIALALFIVASRYFLCSAQHADRDLYPKFHDEFMYLLQTRMLAHGRLWEPQHPLADFFDSFLIVVRPVYAGIYFPGTALAHVPGVWLGLAPWWTSIAISAAGVGLLYILVTDVADGIAGLLAAILAVSTEQWRAMAVPTMSHPLTITLVLATALCLVRWSRRGEVRWAAAAGALGAWAVITRPLDACVLLLPAFVAALIELRANQRLILRPLLLSLATASLMALPFLSLQLMLDRGATGHWLQTPVTAYDDENFPGMRLGGSSAALPVESPSRLPQVRDYYREFLRPAFVESARRGFLKRWLVDRFPAVLRVALPAWPVLLLLPLGVLSLRSTWRISLACGLLTVPFAYALLPIYLAHYGLVAAPAALLIASLGIETLRRYNPRIAAGAIIGLIVLAVGMLPEVRGAQDHFVDTPFLAVINDKLAALEHTPAVVLFTYRGRTDVHEEPVYNIDSVSPDSATVIRAQDLGPRDVEIFRYYPERFFYRCDRTNAEFTPLGFGKDLAATKR